MKIPPSTPLRLIPRICHFCKPICHTLKFITSPTGPAGPTSPPKSSEGDGVNNAPLQVSSARGTIILGEKLFTLIKQNVWSKSALFSKAQLAGINGLRSTSNLIPSLGHNILVPSVGIRATLDERTKSIVIVSTVKCECSFDLSTEAMMVVAIAALTIYDMGKKHNHDVHIKDIEIISKGRGKGGIGEDDGDQRMLVREYDKTPIDNNEPVIVPTL